MGLAFILMFLATDKPHNPMINAGAIVVTSLVKNRNKLADRFDYVSVDHSLILDDKLPNLQLLKPHEVQTLGNQCLTNIFCFKLPMGEHIHFCLFLCFSNIADLDAVFDENM